MNHHGLETHKELRDSPLHIPLDALTFQVSMVDKTRDDLPLNASTGDEFPTLEGAFDLPIRATSLF